jgi:predicted secreted protein
MGSLKRLTDRFRGKPDLRDVRSRKVVLAPHCVLNQNARVAGAAERPAAVVELITGLLDRDVGILQMPCPELCAFGLDRAHVRVEIELRTPENKAISRRLARELVRQVNMYLDCGIQVLGVLGKNGSPSCGVEETWANNGVCAGSGAFIEVLEEELRKDGITLEITGIRDSEPDKAIEAVDRWLSSLKRA